MINAAIVIEKNGLFSISEQNNVYKIPFDIIFETGRKLFFYSDKNSSTPVENWYNRLSEQYKKRIFIENNRGSSC